MSLDVEQNSFIWDDIISEKIMPIRSANIVNNKINILRPLIYYYKKNIYFGENYGQ